MRARLDTRLRILALAVLLAACDQGSEQAAPAPAPAAPPPTVSVVPVGREAVTPAASFTGRVEAVDKVDLRARVEGFLEQRSFTEGQDVKRGDLLFTIEKAQYEAAVAQARGNVARAQATLDNAQLQLDRANELVRNRNIPQATRDDRQAERDSAQAELTAMQAALQVALLNLSYTEIQAPIAGRIGLSAFSVGNLVNPASGVLATIVSQDPIYVSFPVSSRQLLQVREQAARQQTDASRYQVRVQLPDGSTYDQTGVVDFVGVQTDPSTDTVTVRAQFPNPRRVLVDGALVGVIVEEAEPTQVLVVPQAAVLTDQAGPYVLVVDAANKVEQRRIETGQVTGVNTTVTKGLKEGDRIVTDGLLKVRPGQTVQATGA